VVNDSGPFDVSGLILGYESRALMAKMDVPFLDSTQPPLLFVLQGIMKCT
jgi:hypothetical protein